MWKHVLTYGVFLNNIIMAAEFTLDKTFICKTSLTKLLVSENVSLLHYLPLFSFTPFFYLWSISFEQV